MILIFCFFGIREYSQKTEWLAKFAKDPSFIPPIFKIQQKHEGLEITTKLDSLGKVGFALLGMLPFGIMLTALPFAAGLNSEDLFVKIISFGFGILLLIVAYSSLKEGLNGKMTIQIYDDKQSFEKRTNLDKEAVINKSFANGSEFYYHKVRKGKHDSHCVFLKVSKDKNIDSDPLIFSDMGSFLECWFHIHHLNNSIQSRDQKIAA